MKKILSFLTKKPLALAAVALFSMSSFAQETGAPTTEGGTTTEATAPTQKIWAKLTDSSLLKPFLKVTLVDEVQGKIYTVGEDGYQKEAEDFVEKIFIPTDYVNRWLNSFVEQEQKFSPELTPKDKDLFLRNYEMEYIVNRLKRVFYVDYKTAIKKLLESDWQYKFMFDSYEEAEAFYLECLKKHDEEYVDKIEWLNGEPEPLPWDYTDFSAIRQYIDVEL